MMRIAKSLFVTGVMMLVLAAPVFVFADGERSIQVGLSGGVLSIPAIDDLNDRLESQGYPDFDTAYGTLGGMLRLRFDRLMVGIEGHAFDGKTETYGNYDVSLSGGYGLIEVGYDIFREGGFRIYPILGIGMGTLSLSIQEKSGASFNDILADPGREANISDNCLIANASIAVEYYKRITEKSGLVVGIQAGYNVALYNAGWTYDTRGNDRDGHDVSGAPDVDFNGFAMNVNVGWLFEI
jgi:hypothetical protein